MTELYIEGQRMDTGPDTIIARTFQQNLLSSQGSVDSPYTNAFKLPYTRNNAKVLGNPEETTSLTDTPYTKLDTLIRQDGIEQFPNSIAEVQGFEDGAYNVQVFAGAVPFFDLLGDKSIQELDFAAYRHAWNYFSVAAGGFEEMYIYDLIDRGKPLDYTKVHPSFLYPSVFAKAVWERIFQEAGVGLSMSPNEDLNRLILPFCNEKPVHTQEWIEAHTHTYPMVPKMEGGYWRHIVKVPVQQQGKLKLTLDIELTRMDGPVSVFFYLFRGEQTISYIEETTTFTTLGKQTFTANILVEPGYDLNNLFVRVNLPDSGVVSFDYSYANVTVAYEEEVFFGSEWDLSVNLPDIKQKDFVLALCKMFGWSMVYEPYSATMQIKPLADVLANLEKAKDWTHKVDYSFRPKTTYKLPETAIRNLYLWAEDDTVPEGLGNGVIVASNEHLESERTAVEMPFAASESINGLLRVPLFSRSNPVLEIPVRETVKDIPALNALGEKENDYAVLVEDATGDPTVAHGGAVYFYINSVRGINVEGWYKQEQEDYDTESLEPRIALLTDATRSFMLKQGPSTHQVTRRVADFAGLHFGNLLDKYHKVTQRVLSRVQLTTLRVRLTAQDFAEVDSTIPIWVEQFKDYYYLNKITDYTSEAVPCEAELIKLN